MRIGLVDVDGRGKRKKWGATVYPNLALAKIAKWHKVQGDEVEWAIPFVHYDRVYKSKVFNFSPDDLVCYDADEVIKGGTGYDIHSQLPDEIDRMQPDYSIYPNVPSDTAFGFLTRGCPNKCPWCVVPIKEGKIRPYMDVDDIAIENRANLVLMDNNILAAGDYAVEQLEKIIQRGYRIDFNQAMDARLVTEDYARLLARCKWIKYIRFGCDTPGQIKECERAIALLERHGIHTPVLLYTMLHGDMEECYNRISRWRVRLHDSNRVAVDCHAQPFRDPKGVNHPPQWQLDMASWCNKKQLFWSIDFNEFRPRKGFCCSAYFNGAR